MPENPSVRLQPEGVGTHYAPGDGLDYVRHRYRVTVALGQRVRCNGAAGTVIFNPAWPTQYVHVKFDDHPAAPCHPTWNMEYL